MHAPILLVSLFANAVLGGNSAWAQASTPDELLSVDSEGYQNHAVGFFNTYCANCHSGETPEGDFAIDNGLEPNFANRGVAARWREVINVLSSHEMPPAGEDQPTPEAVAGLIDWATGEMIRVEMHQRKQHVTLRRLNRNEYRNTIRDWVGINFDTSHFEPETGDSDRNRVRYGQHNVIVNGGKNRTDGERHR